ncbi:hypothetical protein EMPS_09740 [Entomortierella parvispora]|uniref:JmjC domain-containing histone demethylation protein 1 n=1 Tax=Entomortierella parvispora TaxID=205924 RepID=A0A9P3M0B6_9FUNG|nr:hypothetical protein EMPS_09740 [Entomortierella parvispora]
MRDPCDLCKSQKVPETGIQICCDACNICYHLTCLKLDISAVETFEKYHCPNCEPTAGPSTLFSLDAKTTLSALRWKDMLEERTFEDHDFLTMEGKDVTLDYLRSTGFKKPLVVKLDKNGSTKGLDMSMPSPSFTVDDVKTSVGEMHTVGVIDVATQSEADDWTLGRWAEYFNTEPKDRIRNVISLEVSNTSLAKEIKVPRIVRELDWVRNFWPVERTYAQPKVLLYCLMGVENSYTDFHIDFGGSSVFYHVVSGSKIFYVAEPTPENLEIYINWCNSPERNKSFLGDLFPRKCFKVEIKQGDTLLIPSGWIHAVFTPETSVVFGGNFVHSLHVPMQCKIAQIERTTNTPLKYRYPSFERLSWFVVLGVYKKEKKSKVYLFSLSTAELHGLIELCKYVYSRQVLALPFEDTILSPTSNVSDESVLVEDYTAREIREILTSMPSEVAYLFIGWVELLRRLALFSTVHTAANQTHHYTTYQATDIWHEELKG